ncbi:proline-rich protein 36-like [Tigriopus californicus]|uniref:proline-rich protein 36-like n=1 Tax=Tigriopus californicus TaxID=6832 RepID=UPI0027DA9CAA|nr:proline-rich protein 36-like [Tigriopus californicus]
MFWPWWILIGLAIIGLLATALYCFCDSGRISHANSVLKGWVKPFLGIEPTPPTSPRPPSHVVVQVPPTFVPQNGTTLSKLDGVPSTFGGNVLPSSKNSELSLAAEQVLPIVKPAGLDPKDVQITKPTQSEFSHANSVLKGWVKPFLGIEPTPPTSPRPPSHVVVQVPPTFVPQNGTTLSKLDGVPSTFGGNVLPSSKNSELSLAAEQVLPIVKPAGLDPKDVQITKPTQSEFSHANSVLKGWVKPFLGIEPTPPTSPRPPSHVVVQVPPTFVPQNGTTLSKLDGVPSTFGGNVLPSSKNSELSLAAEQVLPIVKPAGLDPKDVQITKPTQSEFSHANSVLKGWVKPFLGIEPTPPTSPRPPSHVVVQVPPTFVPQNGTTLSKLDGVPSTFGGNVLPSSKNSELSLAAEQVLPIVKPAGLDPKDVQITKPTQSEFSHANSVLKGWVKPFLGIEPTPPTSPRPPSHVVVQVPPTFVPQNGTTLSKLDGVPSTFGGNVLPSSKNSELSLAAEQVLPIVKPAGLDPKDVQITKPTQSEFSHANSVLKGWVKPFLGIEPTPPTSPRPPSHVVVQVPPTFVPQNGTTLSKLDGVPSTFGGNVLPSSKNSELSLAAEQVLPIVKPAGLDPKDVQITKPTPSEVIPPSFTQKRGAKTTRPPIKRASMKPIQPDIGVRRYNKTVYLRIKNANYNLSYRSKSKHMSRNELTVSIAKAMSRKRAIHIPVNTVFEEPTGWQLWETTKSDRVVSSNMVQVMQCVRTSGENIDVEDYGFRYVIFERLNMGHHFRGTRLNL